MSIRFKAPLTMWISVSLSKQAGVGTVRGPNSNQCLIPNLSKMAFRKSSGSRLAAQTLN